MELVLLCVNFSLVAVIHRWKLMHVWTQGLGNKAKAYKENHMHLNMLSMNNEISPENFAAFMEHKEDLEMLLSAYLLEQQNSFSY